MRKYLFLAMLVSTCFIAWAEKVSPFKTGDYVLVLKKVTDVMVNDATSPVAASRYYAYITLAAYETCAVHFPNQLSFANKLKELKRISVADSLLMNSDPALSSLYSLLLMGQRLLPSGYLLKSQVDSLGKAAQKKGWKPALVQGSFKLAESAVDQLMQYVKTDGFSRLSGYSKFTPSGKDGAWEPTGPVFMQALEPHWNRLRPFVLDSAQQFKPPLPAEFDSTTGSSFFQQVKEVYEAGKNLSGDQKAISQFWDCNPFAVQQIGHIEFALKKISPGGHWMGITGIACLKKKLNIENTLRVHTLVAITLADAFISCWDEKYRSNRVRPETVINKWFDPLWRPLLQTPPFPEYTSGHSVISTAAAEILTQLFGEAFSFADDTELEFGLPVRKFVSFRQAADEAAISRFYGGIHYRDAIELGQVQGKEIADCIIRKLSL